MDLGHSSLSTKGRTDSQAPSRYKTVMSSQTNLVTVRSLLPQLVPFTDVRRVDKEGSWGIRIESALVVRNVPTKHTMDGQGWLGFERLTVVPIQTRMIKENMLTKEEKSWIKVSCPSCGSQKKKTLTISG